MRVKWLKKALQNLEDEAEYIAKDDPKAAQAVVRRIVEHINQLPSYPAMGRPGRILGTRELVVKKTRYIVPYRVNVQNQEIEVLRVFHSARRLPRRW